MKFLLKSLVVLILSAFVANVSLANDDSSATEFIEKVFSPAINADHIIGGSSVGTTKKSVGNFLLKDGLEISIGKGGINVEKKPSFVIMFTQFLLKMTVAIWVTMVILNGVLYIIKTQKGEHDKDTVTNLIMVVVGIVLALSSVLLVRVMRSVSTTLLKEVVTQHSISSQIQLIGLGKEMIQFSS